MYVEQSQIELSTALPSSMAYKIYASFEWIIIIILYLI